MKFKKLRDSINNMETIFFGAGASKYFDIPTTKEFPDEFEDYLGKNRENNEKRLYEKIKDRCKEATNLDLEAILTLLEDLSDKKRLDRRFEHPSILFPLGGKSKYNESDVKYVSEAAKQLKEKLKRFIVQKCSSFPEKFKDKISVYTEFFDLIFREYSLKTYVDEGKRQNGRHCEIFTTNYDLCIENYCSNIKMPFINGQTINNTRTQIVDITKNNFELYHNKYQGFQIYKLHGSINWYKIRDKDIRDVIFWSDIPAEAGAKTFDNTEIESELIIYPIQEKQIYKDPFSDMFNRLKDSLETSDYCFVVGYSFRDEEINNIFDDAMFYRDRKGQKTKIFFIDPSAEAIIENRLESINELDNIEIKPIDKEFSIEAIKGLQEMIK